MKISSSLFKEMVSTSISPAKSPNEMLRMAFLGTKEGKLIFITTDSIRSVRWECAVDGEIVPCLVPVANLKQVIKSKSKNVTIKQTEERLEIRARSSFKIPTLPTDEFPFPEMLRENDEYMADFPSEDFLEALRTVSNFLPDHSDQKEYIKAVDVCEWQGKMSLFATDASTFCLRCFSEDQVERFQIPMVSVNTIQGMTGRNIRVVKRSATWNDSLEETHDASMYFFKSKKITSTASRPSYPYPNWKNTVRPLLEASNDENLVVVDRDELIDALKDNVAGEGKLNQVMTVEINNGTMKLSMSSTSGFSIESEVPVKTKLSSIFGARPQYMLRCIQSLYSDKVLLHVAKDMSMVLFRNDDDSDDFAALAMMRL